MKQQSHVLPALVAIVLVVAGLVASLVVEKFQFETIVGAGIGAAVSLALAVAAIAAQ